MKYLVIGMLALAIPASAQETGNRLSLICAGGGYANKVDQSTAQAWNNYGDSATATVQSPSRVGFEDQAQVWIEGEEGRIRRGHNGTARCEDVRSGENQKDWLKTSGRQPFLRSRSSQELT